MPLVSVVIRSKNEGASLACVLQAVVRQTVPPAEIIIVDSGSTDNTLEIASAYHAVIHRLAPESFTYGSALNLGLASARGEIGVSLAGHALPANDRWLEALIQPFDDRRVAGAASRALAQSWAHRSWALASLDALYRWIGLRGAAVTSRLFVNSCSAVRLDVWRELPFHASLPSCEDQLWSRQVIRRGYHVAYCPDSLVYHAHRLPLRQKLAGIRRDRLAMREVNRILTQEHT